MVFWVPDENTFDAAVKDLDKELSKTIKNIKTTDKGTSAKKVVIILILTFAAPGIAEKHAQEAAQFIASIKKIG